VLIIRRSNCVNTASGIVFSVSDRPHTGRSFTDNTKPDTALIKSDLLMMSKVLLETCKGKSVPLQARRGPEGSRKLRFSYFVTTAQDGGRLSALSTGRFYLQEILLVLISVRG